MRLIVFRSIAESSLLKLSRNAAGETMTLPRHPQSAGVAASEHYWKSVMNEGCIAAESVFQEE